VAQQCNHTWAIGTKQLQSGKTPKTERKGERKENREKLEDRHRDRQGVVPVVAVEEDDLSVEALDRLGSVTRAVPTPTPYDSSRLHDWSVLTPPIHSILYTQTNGR